MTLSKQEAAIELLKRRKARTSLVDYAKAIDVPGRPASEDPDEWVFLPVETGLADHHVLVLNIIEQVILGEIPRAMFFLPPGSAKSTYGSVVAPTWAMGRQDDTKIILTSYGSDLARKHGRRARQIAKSPQYRNIFGAKISSETAAADEWAVTNGSEYLACGILSSITGNRAHGLIVDDPIKGRQEADSETVRNRTWDAYQDDLRTRLIPGGWEIIIQTRWHEDDLAGRILPEKYAGESGLIMCRDGREWYIVCLPAECERADDPLNRKIGDCLWPEWFSEEHFKPFKAQPRTWNALFQQRPQPEEGTYFQRKWFHRYRPDEKPVNMHIYGSSDYAVSDSKGDFTEHGVIGLDCESDIWILDWWYGQKEADEWIERQLDLMRDYKPFCWFGEAGVIRRAIKPFLARRQLERKVYGRVEWIPSVSDKPTRARAFQARSASRKVHLPVGEMGDRIIDQLVRFPTGAHDDIVDVLSLFCMALDQAHPAIADPPVREPRSMAAMHIDEITSTEKTMDQQIMEDIVQEEAMWEQELYGGPEEEVPREFIIDTM